MKKLLILLISVLMLSFVSASDFTPQGDINLRDLYNIENALGYDGVNATFDDNVTASSFIGNVFSSFYNWIIGSTSSEYLSFNGTQLDFNETKLNTTIGLIAVDTNETTRFNALIITDCVAGTLVIGVQTNGTVLCVTDSTTNSSYLLNTGDTMTGNLNMSDNNITNILATYYSIEGCTDETFGTFCYDSTYDTLRFVTSSGQILQMNQEMTAQVKNLEGSNVLDGSVIYLMGATGDNSNFKLAKADNLSTSGLLGVVTKDCNNNQVCPGVFFGVIHGLNTIAFSAGDHLYLSATEAGNFTTTPPEFPDVPIWVATALRIHSTEGTIFVFPRFDSANGITVDTLGLIGDFIQTDYKIRSLEGHANLNGKNVMCIEMNGTTGENVCHLTLQPGGIEQASIWVRSGLVVPENLFCLNNTNRTDSNCWATEGGFNWNIADFNSTNTEGADWGITGELEVIKDIDTHGNVTAKWFNGIFNWTTFSPFLSFDGVTLSFDDSLLNTTIDARDTNETTRFNALVTTDCTAGNLVIGVQANGTVLCAADADTQYTAGQGLNLSGTTFNHNDSSSQSSSDNSGRTYIQDILLDTYGHIQTIVTATETVVDSWAGNFTNYFTKTEVLSFSYYNVTSLVELDPFWVGNDSLVARAANCPAGQFAQNTTNTGIQCATPSGSGDITSVQGDSYITNGSNSGDVNLVFNDTKLNLTIDDRDNDTQYTAGLGLNLTGTVFAHNDSSSQASSDNSGRTYIQDILLDGFGHITSLVTATETVVDSWAGNFTSYFTSSQVLGFSYFNSTNLEIVTDTTPQLGGYLDTNTNDIGSTADEIENIYVSTNTRIFFGDGQEASIFYNGTALIISG